ncbi:MAG TPA: TRAP transporter substrate-binding protein DctP [Candidatus Acidoferrum sp.]|nr:TRAP transporter substrate-binding protein DctP [Candidatus Acidoferrum sp.]
MEALTSRKKIGKILLPLGLLFLTPGRSQAQTRIRLATLLPRGSSHYHLLEGMGQEWRTVSGGGITLTIYPDGTMGSEEDTVRRMRVGEIQAATLSVAGLSEIDPSVGALQKIPMAYHSLEELEYVRSKMQPEMEKRLEQKGFIVLFWADAGWVHIFSRKPALRPDDFKKMKVFVGIGDQEEIGIVKGLGFQAVPLAWTDVLTSLQTGLVDAVPAPPFFALAGQYDLVARHMLELKYAVLVGATVVTKKAWEKIPVEKRAELLKASAEAGRQMQARSRIEANEAVEAMKKRGLQVQELSPEIEEEWRQFAEGVYPKMRGTMVPADTFDEVRRLVSEYRAAQGKTNHE